MLSSSVMCMLAGVWGADYITPHTAHTGGLGGRGAAGRGVDGSGEGPASLTLPGAPTTHILLLFPAGVDLTLHMLP